MTFIVIDGYLFDAGKSGRYISLDSPNVIIKNSKFTTSSEVSNTGALVQGPRGTSRIYVENSEFEGGTYFQRGLQSDTSDIVVTRSRFHNTGEAGIEKNDRSANSSLVVTDSYFSNDPGWPRAQHVDGIQVGGAKSVSIQHNTVLSRPYGGTEGDTNYVSNSALGLFAELGNIGPTVIENNLLAGGGCTVYLESKQFAWTGPVEFRNNTFDTRFSPKTGIWAQLYPKGLPSNLTWTGNTSSGGSSVSLADALKQ